MPKVQSRTLHCTLPLGMTEAGLEQLLAEHSRHYHVDLSHSPIEGDRFRVQMLGRLSNIDATTHRLGQDLSGWGGRVEVEEPAMGSHGAGMLLPSRG